MNTDLFVIPSNIVPLNTSKPNVANQISSNTKKSLIINIGSNLTNRDLNNNNTNNGNANALGNANKQANKKALVTQPSISSSGTDGSKTDLIAQSIKKLDYASNNNQHQGVSSNNQAGFEGTPAVVPYSHQITSINESKAKQLCKKRPTDCIGHTETQLIRCYPNARRFDSSNFSPISFWSCGMQLIALNYQTVDAFQIVNLSLFEQNMNAGYVLKPPVLWNKQHPEYGRFNPFEKKKDGEYVSVYVKLISGQYLTESMLNASSVITSSTYNNNTQASSSSAVANAVNSSVSLAGASISGISGVNNATGMGASAVAAMINGSTGSGSVNKESNSTSGLTGSTQPSHRHHHHRSSGVELLQTSSTFVEIEILGIPCDCSKEKTKTFNRNALNPIWNEEFVFHVVFPELAFVRFSVMDSQNSHVIAQRVVPLKRLQRGFRHLRLRNNQNQNLELSTLFLYSRQQVEHVQQTQSNLSSSGIYSSSTDIPSNFGPLFTGASSSKAKHKQFKLTIYGLNGDDDDINDASYSNISASALGSGVQVKVTQETTVYQVIEQVCKNCFIFHLLHVSRLFRGGRSTVNTIFTTFLKNYNKIHFYIYRSSFLLA